MLFNSYIFIFLFLPITILGYFGLNKIKKPNLAKIFLCCMSLWFYAYSDISFLWIICTSIFINWFGSKILKFLAQEKYNKIRLFTFIILILLNIGILIYYKYFDFLILNINKVFNTSFSIINLILPLGISFFTFQQLAYLIDSYKSKEKGLPYKFLDYITFVTFFPKIIQGPIALHYEIIPQLEDKENRKIKSENIAKGLFAFAFGLAKKVLIADLFGQVANIGFANVEGLNTITAMLAMFSYTIQIYFDFSGYCDMATGVALMLNIKLPINFNSPYKATNILDFWKRWHITLTRFFTQYVYIPLGGNRKGKIRTYINVLIIFLISGIWHGANWTFIIWGVMHGIASVINRIFKNKIEKQNPVLNWIITFSFIGLTWVMFRANSVSDAIIFYKRLLSFDFANTSMLADMVQVFNLVEMNIIYMAIPQLKAFFNTHNLMIIVFMVLAIIAILGMKNTNERIENFKPTKRKVFIVVILLVISIMSLSQVSTFLYVNF